MCNNILWFVTCYKIKSKHNCTNWIKVFICMSGWFIFRGAGSVRCRSGITGWLQCFCVNCHRSVHPILTCVWRRIAHSCSLLYLGQPPSSWFAVIGGLQVCGRWNRRSVSWHDLRATPIFVPSSLCSECQNGSSNYFYRRRPVLLLGVPGDFERPGDHPLRTQLLPGLHWGLLEPAQAKRPVQLPSVQAGVQPETSAEQKHGPGWSGGKVSAIWISSPGCQVQCLYREEMQSCEILPGVLRVLLRGSPESPRGELPREET